MRLSMFKSKIHRATVTHADLAYDGSVTIDASQNRPLADRNAERAGPVLDSLGFSRSVL
jgi:aspartate decarboxylase